ncbi:MAG: L,D-transpeptidase [Chthoniobacterales bacterium]
MQGGIKLWGFLMFLAAATVTHAQSNYSVEIDLGRQTAYLIEGRQVVLSSPISTGRAGHLTESGSFKIIEKERNHFSSMYGKIVDAYGRTVVSDADADMKVPRGGKFIPAPMRYFMRFHSATGMHAGYLPGYPASHGCVRMPEENAISFFNALQVGTPVHVFGRTRTGEYRHHGPQPSGGQRYQRRYDPRLDPRYDPRFDPRFPDPSFIDPRYAPPPGWWR